MIQSRNNCVATFEVFHSKVKLAHLQKKSWKNPDDILHILCIGKKWEKLGMCSIVIYLAILLSQR